MAHEALKACIDSVVHASNMIKLRKTKFDGQLFLIKHLLILREQITPFNIIHSSSETSLDFSHYRRQQSLNNLVANALPEVKGQLISKDIFYTFTCKGGKISEFISTLNPSSKKRGEISILNFFTFGLKAENRDFAHILRIGTKRKDHLRLSHPYQKCTEELLQNEARRSTA